MRLLRIFLPVLIVLGGALGAQKLTVPAPLLSADTLRIPLSGAQRRVVGEFDRQIAELQSRKNLYLSAIVAGKVDPDSIGSWQIQLTDSAVVLISPRKK